VDEITVAIKVITFNVAIRGDMRLGKRVTMANLHTDGVTMTGMHMDGITTAAIHMDGLIMNDFDPL